MIFPIDYSVMCRINLNGLSTFQRIQLKNYNHMISKLPKGTYVDILCYWQNKIYGWSRVNSVVTGVDTSTHEIRTDKRGLGFDIPRESTDLKFVTLPENFFPNDFGIKEKILGTICSSFVKEFDLRAKDRKRKLTINALFKSNISSYSGVSLRINNNIFNYSQYHSSIQSIMYDYVSVIDKYPIDVYLTHILLQNNILIPYVFGGEKLQFDDDNFKVPLSTYWIFQLLYGRTKNVYFEMLEPSSWGRVNVTRLKTRLRKTYKRTEGAIINFRSNNVTPIIINGFAMRFV